jgi:hypothetical protein
MGAYPTAAGSTGDVVMLLTQETELRRVARERVASGDLPSEIISRMWASRGRGQSCSLCDRPIQNDEVEYEIEADIAGAKGTFLFHWPCHAVWQLACVEIGQEKAAGSKR